MDVDTFIQTTPSLRFAFAIKAKVGPVQDLGQTARGHRRIIDILGGEVHGPRLEGEILPGGADWQIVRPDGTIEVVARYTIRSSHGRPDLRPERGPARGESGDPGAHVEGRAGAGRAAITSARRRASRPSEPTLKWLERATFVGVATRAPDRVAIGFHEVL